MERPIIRHRIRELREARGWSQEYLARRIGVSVATISRWERREIVPSLDGILLVAEVLGVSLDDLVWIERPST